MGIRRIAVLGTGGVGGYFGALLAKAGNHVSFLARGEHLAAIRATGLHVRGTLGDLDIVPAAIYDPADPEQKFELVVVAIKNYDLPAALPTLAALIGPATSVLLLLNGIEAPDLVAPLVPQGRLLIGQCGIGAWVEVPGLIRQEGRRRTITLAAWTRPAPILGVSADLQRAVADLLRAAGVSVSLSADAPATLWHKLVWAASYGAVAALTGLSAGELRRTPHLRATIHEAISEALRVARGLGVSAPAAIASEWMAVLDSISPAAIPSLLRDRRAGRRLEVNALSGAIVRAGAVAGIATPLHGLMWAALQPMGPPMAPQTESGTGKAG